VTIIWDDWILPVFKATCRVMNLFFERGWHEIQIFIFFVFCRMSYGGLSYVEAEGG